MIQPAVSSASNGGPRRSAVCTDKASSKDFDVEILGPLGIASQPSFHPKLTGTFCGAHACIDQKTGDLYHYNLDLKSRPTYRIFCTSPASGSTRILATITDSRVRGSYIHSMFMTEHYVILCVWPAYYARLGIGILWERNMLDAIEPFDDTQKCTWLVIDRVGSRGVVKKVS